MKGSMKREEADPKKKYIFFSDPDIIVRRAESSAAAAQAQQFPQLCQQQGRNLNSQYVPENASTDHLPSCSTSKRVDNILTCHPVQPYPFTFITAVKRKLALGTCPETCKKAYEPNQRGKVDIDLDRNKVDAVSKQNLYQTAEKMDFIKPLKVPDLKISPKTLDCSPREGSSMKEATQQRNPIILKKFETTSKEVPPQKSDRSSRSIERVQRRLDFTLSEESPIKSCENIEPLKAPDFFIASSLAKKKEHARDSSREKENRSKRIKKDDSNFSREDELLQDMSKKSRSLRHLSRKDIVEPIFKASKNENVLTLPRENDFTLKKPKSKNFVTSTARKDDDKRHRSSSIQSTKSTRDRSLETRSRTFSNESVADRTAKLQERVTVREGFRGKATETLEYKNDHQLPNMLRQGEDQKYKYLESRSLKQQSKSTNQSQTRQLDGSPKETKRTSDKQKCFTNKIEEKSCTSVSEISEEIETASDSNISLRTRSDALKIGNFGKNECFLYSETSLQQSKSKNSDRCIWDVPSTLQSDKSARNPEDLNYIESSSGRSSIANARKNEESLTQSVMATDSAQTNTNCESKNSNEESFSEVMLDPRRISFRDDSLTPQDEFCDLVTPDINLTLRSKRKKKAAQGTDSDMDVRSPKYKPTTTTQTEDKGIQLLHPTALHMQFQAELHLLDSFHESLRQVMDVEKCLYDVRHEQEQELLQKQKQMNEEMQKQLIVLQSDKDAIDNDRYSGRNRTEVEPNDKAGAHISKNVAIEGTNAVDIKITRGSSEFQGPESHGLVDCETQLQCPTEKFNDDLRKQSKSAVRVAEVQTQTVNDIATQTDVRLSRHNVSDKFREISGITYQRGSLSTYEIPQLSVESLDHFEDLDQIEDVSLPSRMRTMSEISLHETTSSIKTETGTEISISTRDVTCSFNKYLDLEMAQLIKDEKQRYDKIEMLFKSREKSLNDRTKKLVKLEEQKRVLRDTGQDSRISSVKKKQRALLLKLQQEKDEMNRLKELHKMASQERKLMLQKQRNMFNPQMSTKNILTKLKRSADSQSPRRLSGPMKGYDIRSPSSMSSLVDSDKSQLDRFQIEMKSQTSDARSHKLDEKTTRSNLDASVNERFDFVKVDPFNNLSGESNACLMKSDKSEDAGQVDAKQQKLYSRTQKGDIKSKYDVKSRKYEEKMPGVDVLRLKSHHLDVESKLTHGKSMNLTAMQCSLQKSKSNEASKSIPQDLDKSISEYVKSESDTLVEELSKKSKSSQATESHTQNSKAVRERESALKDATIETEILKVESDSVIEESRPKRSKSSQVAENVLQASSKVGKKNEKLDTIDKDSLKKSQHSPESKSSSKRKGSRGQKTKSSSDMLSENILRSKSSSQVSEEIIKHHSKRSKVECADVQSEDNYENSILEELDFNESQSSLQALVKRSRAVKKKNYELLKDIASEYDTKETATAKDFTERGSENFKSESRKEDGDLQNLGNISTRSQVSTLTISRHSSGDSEKSYSRSVVIRAQDHHFKTSKKLEQILSAREAALASRRNCVEEWIAWHARLRAEETRIARMEQAAFKLVSATSNALSYHDTTVSSDTSDMEGRIELLTEKLSERRAEMTRLKKEARKQAKQRLKALETNLLNQIKKYDTTIHEMRKKLELKKAASRESDSEKLAIESRSLVDYKIPEISIKRIQEICKSSDLLRSRSESDLIFEKDREKTRKSVYAMEYEGKKEDESDSQRSVGSVESKSTEKSDCDRRDTGHSDRSVFDEVRSLTSTVPRASSIANDDNKSISEEIESDEYGSSRGSISIQSQTTKHDLYSVMRAASDVLPVESVALVDVPRSEYSVEHVSSTRSDKLSQSSVVSENIRSELSAVKPRTDDMISEAKESNVSENIPESISKFSYPRTALNSERSIEDNCETLDYRSRSRSQTNSDLFKRSSLKSPSRQKSSETMNEEIGSESEYSKSNLSRSFSARPVDSSVVEEIKVTGSLEDSPTFSRKLNILQLDNKNLNDDISMLENDLKALSDMVSRFSKRSDDRLKSDVGSRTIEDKVSATVDEKSTSKDVSEDLPRSNSIDKSDRSDDIIDATVDQQVLFESDSISGHTSLPQTDSEIVHDKNSRNKMTEIMLKIMPKDVSSCRSNQKIDFEARSKEILNEIEKSIISEHVKSSEDLKDSTLHLQKENESALNDLNSLQDDIRSIARIISKMAENKGSVDPDTEIISEAALTPKESRNVRTDMLDASEGDLDKSSIGRSASSIRSSQISEAKDLGELARPESESLPMTLDDSPIRTRADEAFRSSERSTDVPLDKDPASFHGRSYAIRNEEEYSDASDVADKERIYDPSSGKERNEIECNLADVIGTKKDEVSNGREQRLDWSEDGIERDESTIVYHDEDSVTIVNEERQSFLTECDRKSILDLNSLRKLSSVFVHGDDDVKRIVSENASENGYNEEHEEAIESTFLDKDWTTSDSFEIQQNVAEVSVDRVPRFDITIKRESEEASAQGDGTREIDENDRTLISNIDDMSAFVPNHESTKIEDSNNRFDDAVSDDSVTKTEGMTVDEIDDILDVIAREGECSKKADDTSSAVPNIINKVPINVETDAKASPERGAVGIEMNELLIDEDQTWQTKSVASLEVEKHAQDNVISGELEPEDSTKILHEIIRESSENVGKSKKDTGDTVKSEDLEEPSNSVETAEKDERSSMINISLSVEIEEGEAARRRSLRSRDITITELLPEDEKSKTLPEFEIDAKIELANDGLEESHGTELRVIDEASETEYLENATREEDPDGCEDIQEALEHDEEEESSEGEQLDNFVEVAESRLDTVERMIAKKQSQSIQNAKSDRAYEIEVQVDVHSEHDAVVESEDADWTERGRTVEFDVVADRENPAVSLEAIDKTFEVTKDLELEDISEESLEVSEILDRSESQRWSGKTVPNKYAVTQKSETREVDREVSSEPSKVNGKLHESRNELSVDLLQESEHLSRIPDGTSDRSEDVSQKHDIDASNTESSEGVDTPRGVPEIEMDSPREPNDSRLDVDVLDDDLLGGTTVGQNDEAKPEFRVTPIVTTSEKDIEAMIDKLKASLEQPGLEVAELDAKLLRIEQLQIELQIKRLEAEEVSYYVREIPNKPPPPYTPPGGGRLPTSQASPSPPPPAVVPTNIEELTVFTEKATKLIFAAKQSDVDIASLEPPLEICELSKDSSEIARRDRRIYNTFLFDLCKEIAVEVYQSEYEKPGPSWSKPNVKTTPTVKIPKSVEELNEYVGKEVATLFGFKTKLQRENMVMRWSRKRRDRVDELLAREAQAEEDEWTKFHHDELAVKNELTTAILDSLIAETASIIKAVYAKKRKVVA